MKISKEKAVIGFIGTGVMGASMAGHILKAGYRLLVYNRTKDKAQVLLNQGAVWSEIGNIAATCDVIITMVGVPQDVEQTYLGEGGILANAKKGSYLVDMTTSSPKLAAKIYQAARDRGIYALDAPVSGGDVGAREARLSIMVGGDQEAFEAVSPLFELMGKNVMLLGPAGSGQYTKMSNQIVIAGNMMGVSEALAYAKKAGLDPANVIKSIETGAAGSWSLSNLGPRMVAGNFAPGFYVKHFIKDMKIALESAQEMGLKTAALDLALKLYQQLAAEGYEDSGTQALYKIYDRA